MPLKSDEFDIEFMRENDFIRKKCNACDSFFWTQRHDLDLCMEFPCVENEFIGKSPAKVRADLDKMRNIFLKFFQDNSHTVINPYPVVARWRDDLLVTIASIVDFQPYVTNGEMPPPANPLVVSQPCLRFEDIDNVGLNFGRHLTIFEMGGAHAFNYPNKFTYWKDDTIRYHHELLTEKLGVASDLVTYKEHFWSGGGNAGPDLEPNVMGLEISTLVFMYYRVENGNLIPLPVKTVDTGYGIERWAWLSMGTPTAFHVIFGNILDKTLNLIGGKIDEKVLLEASKLSGAFKARGLVAERLGMEVEELKRMIMPFEKVTSILDHTKALVFMLAEGVVPSNVKAGYLARMLARRAYRLLSLYDAQNMFFDIIEMQIKHSSPQFPHIMEMRDEIIKLADVEIKKYVKTLEREYSGAKKKLKTLKSKGRSTVPIDILQELYESHGLHPQQVSELSKDLGVKVEIPSDFFSTLVRKKSESELMRPRDGKQGLMDRIDNLPDTELLYYKDVNQFEFEANVLKVDENFVILDRTAFYSEGGGQLGDRGSIIWDGKKSKVIDIVKVGSISLHKIKGALPTKGAKIKGIVDAKRRRALMIHHTATHILNGAARYTLGEHVWQAGAQKDIDKSRLDITHYAHLTREEVIDIENKANMIVRSNIPVEVLYLQRNDAERKYGFRLYQGGVVPGKEIRVIKIGDWDIEACGGTHCLRTGDIGLIKIIKVERIQDGVERLEFLAGEPAIKFIQLQEDIISKISHYICTPQDKIVASVNKLMMDRESVMKKQKIMLKKIAELSKPQIMDKAVKISDIEVYYELDHDLGEEYQIMVGEQCIKINPSLIYCATVIEGKVAKVIVFCGKNAQEKGLKARELARRISSTIGGSGGGDMRFGRGGGPLINKAKDVESTLFSYIKEALREHSNNG
ncbi:MAG: alanine--tRNA ligase [Candidatus Methylarchaceae archaeon HK02M2]|nr:alanine--tRNA ligase [Candidatus Methylarchaceae archaeon HK02M2]